MNKQWIIWCGLNIEQDNLAKKLGNKCVSIYGSLSNEEKECRLLLWLNKEKQILISKASIFGFGLNLQQCHNVIFMGLSDSFEQYYQAVRRCWRFGQKNPVNVYIVLSDLELSILENIKRKEKDFEIMQSAIKDYVLKHNLKVLSLKTKYEPQTDMRLPVWLKS
jgi:SNF2 family DNA or RNA helicase